MICFFFFFQGYYDSLNKLFAVISYFKGAELIQHSNCIHPVCDISLV